MTKRNYVVYLRHMLDVPGQTLIQTGFSIWLSPGWSSWLVRRLAGCPRISAQSIRELIGLRSMA